MFSLSVLTLLVLIQLAYADHVVFVHGIAGFGPTELLGVGYWGFPKVFGKGQDYLQIFRNKGFTVHYAAVGPVSSNHDRACELYAQIKGTIVDYGEVHSKKYGHKRYAKDYRGKAFVPSWDGKHKVHFVAHSMGGNTVRYLEYLLQKGLPEEVAGTTDPSTLSPLFQTNKPTGGNWIQTLVTISTPHEGSPLVARLGGGIVELLKNLIGAFAGLLGLVPGTEWLYDFKLDQFGLDRKAGESFSDYYSRIIESPVFDPGFKDIASWDLGTEWATEFNSKTQLTYPGTYYFSVSTYQTHTCWFTDQCPNIGIEIPMSLTSSLIGHLNGLCDRNNFCFSDSWERNDGLVPIRSSASPQNGVLGYVAPLDWNPNTQYQPARWYNKNVQRDHLQIIGFRLNLLTLSADDGTYTDVANTILKVKSLTSSLELAEDITEVAAEDQTPVIVGAVVGVSMFAFVVVGAVLIRKRRSLNQQTGNKQPTSRLSSTASNKPEDNIITLKNSEFATNPIFVSEVSNSENTSYV